MSFRDRLNFIESVKVRQAANKHPNGTYVSALVDDETKKKLDNWVTANKIENAADPDQYHSTLIYSRKGIPDVKDYNIKLPITGEISEFKLFPTKTGPKCLVAIVDAKALDETHKNIRKIYGATHDFPDYHAHITLSYDYSGDIPGEVPSIPIKYDKIEIKPLDPDFVPPKKDKE